MELYLGNPKKDINKKAYDYLMARNTEIEGKLNAHLEWNREDSIKSSKIFIQMNEVSISDERD